MGKNRMIKANVTLRMDDVMRRIEGTAAEVQEGLVAHVGEWLRIVIRRTFTQTQASPEGVPWQPLTPKYAARKKGPGILRETGALFEQSTRAVAIQGNKITAGSTLPYAAVHQFGFDDEVEVSAHKFLHAVRSRDVFAKLLNPKLGKETRQLIARGIKIGDVAGHTRHMKIPARPFLPSPEFVEAEGTKVAEQYVNLAVKELDKE
jgi:phage gpG-like protein